jgi:NTP pyrophosphatase (non-canonical NTP hydrolase)
LVNTEQSSLDKYRLDDDIDSTNRRKTMKRDNELEEFFKVLNKTINEKFENICNSSFNESNNQYKDPIPVLKKAICKYGKQAQLDVAVEEMAELTKEIIKSKRGASNYHQIVEELADVYIMMTQIKLIYGIYDEELINAMDLKIARLEKRLQND